MKQRFFIWETSLLTIIILIAAALAACSTDDDPFVKINAILNEVLRMMRDPGQDLKTKKLQIEEYWKNKRPELEQIKSQLEQEITKAEGEARRELFMERFEGVMAKIREIQSLFKAWGLSL